MSASRRIEVNPKVMLGKPVVRGTRIPVELLLRKLSEGATEADLLDAYPRLTRRTFRRHSPTQRTCWPTRRPWNSNRRRDEACSSLPMKAATLPWYVPCEPSATMFWLLLKLARGPMTKRCWNWHASNSEFSDRRQGFRPTGLRRRARERWSHLDPPPVFLAVIPPRRDRQNGRRSWCRSRRPFRRCQPRPTSFWTQTENVRTTDGALLRTGGAPQGSL